MKETPERLEDKLQFLKQYLADGDINNFRRYFLSLHTYDQGQFYLSLEEEERKRMYNFLSPEEMADLFDTIEEDEEFIKDYLQEMNIQYAADMLSEMYTDNAVDILNQLEQKQQKEFLDLMPLDEAEEISDLLVYEDNTAGSIMTTEFVSISANQTIKEALVEVKRQAEEAETIYYLYVTNAKRQLVGVLSLRDLITRKDDELVGNVMGTRLKSVTVTDHQEEVAHAIRDYDFLAVPVIDLVDRLVGIITVDDIIDVIDEEATSDYSGLAGVDVDEKSENPFIVASKRLPWLVTLLFLGMGTSTLISNYEIMVSKASILAVFISLITGTAGNAGTQSLAVAVRRLAEKEDRQNKIGRMIWGELSSGLITGLVTGITVFLLIGIWQSNFVLGLVIGVAMLFAITIANLAGSLIPVLMDKLGFDPAVASGPFITTLSDLTSVFIYFNIAAYFLNFL
ncbi:magnesium transporter [Desemzia sp. FAM 23991]|uniref:magnesium transporter n=1 Tax=unclassified Desemzia TaxID=2685243 RepID=UPI00388B7A67